MMFQLFHRNVRRLGQQVVFRKWRRLYSIESNIEKSVSKTEEWIRFPGASASFSHVPTFTTDTQSHSLSIYRILDRNGEIVDETQDPNLEYKTVKKIMCDMILLNTLDKVLYESQRQGRISFYMTNYGEEASHIGSAAALSNEDVVYGQYREAGVLVWRGFSISEFIDQCFGNKDDQGKGRQMPVHYGSKQLNFVTISSPLATQMPQAVGASYALKLKPGNEKVVICYFGEGAASEGDAHAAFNFAATLCCPIILFCRNNGFAISTPATEQYKGDGIAGRGPGYGINTIRVDGTDVFAVYNATKLAKEYATKNNKPVLVEAMAYRVGHHSTSDDSSAYRSQRDTELWNTVEHPITKLRKYMIKRNWWSEGEEDELVQRTKKQILKQITVSEKKFKPNWKEMFQDVYYDLPSHLKSQITELDKHLQLYGVHYPLQNFAK